MKNVKLGINIDHIATLREGRQGKNPDPLEAARVVLNSGGDMIVMHLRHDRRHIKDADVKNVRENVKGLLHLEMAATKEMEKIALKYRPDSVCLVPEFEDEVTTRGGLNLKAKGAEIKRITQTLSKAGIEVSYFVEPQPQDIRAAHNLGADAVELCTNIYAESWGKKLQAKELEKLQLAAYLAKELKLGLHAGHGLDYYNAAPIARIEGMDYLNIGFSVISRAVFVGLKTAVFEMKGVIQ